MKILVVRDVCGSMSTHGKMYVDGVFFAYTLEDRVVSNGVGSRGFGAIPNGVYRIKSTYSIHHRKYLAELMDVQNYKSVRIQGGSSVRDIGGCILIGANVYRGGITNCAGVVNSISNKLSGAQLRNEFSSILILDNIKDVILYPAFIPVGFDIVNWCFP